MPIILNNITNPEDVVAINNNFDKIEKAWDEKLDRLVSLQGNEMNQDIDMNGKAILNVHVNDEPRSLVNREYVDNKIQSYEAASAVQVALAKQYAEESLASSAAANASAILSSQEAEKAKLAAETAAVDTGNALRGEFVQLKEAAEASAVRAETADTNASSSATAAKLSEEDAASSKVDSEKSRNDAALSATQALTYSQAASSSATLAGQEATTATDKAKESTDASVVAGNEADRAKDEADRASAIIKDSYRHAVESATNNTQTVIYDDAGNPNVMFVFPSMSYQSLGLSEADFGTGYLSCFDTGTGALKSEVFIAAHLASGNGYVSQSGADPRNTIDFDTAKTAIAAKGTGWHLMTAHEWSAIALWCMSNGYQPLGNTYYGQSHAKKFINGQRQDKGLAGDASGSARTLTGTVGTESSHNKILAGIFDLVGNVWEWNDGFKLVNGQLVVSSFNTQAEADWVAQAAFLDSVGGITLSDSVTVTGSPSNEWKSVARSVNYQQNLLLRKLLIEPSTVLPEGRLYMNNADERFPLRGSSWNDGSSSGLAALRLSAARSGRHSNFGFRSAFFA